LARVIDKLFILFLGRLGKIRRLAGEFPVASDARRQRVLETEGARSGWGWGLGPIGLLPLRPMAGRSDLFCRKTGSRYARSDKLR
jgi:hypothetical protein